jgi:hypothetical protein
MNDNEIDARLSALLAPPEEFPDEVFTARVRRAILAEDRLEAARRASWRRFGGELAGTAAIVLAFLLLARISGGGATGLGPGLAAFVMIGFWTVAGLRPTPQP